jgi:hypothetical protein
MAASTYSEPAAACRTRSVRSRSRRRKGNPARGLEGGIELALRPERRPMSVKPPKVPLARTRSGAEANSVHLRGQRVERTPQPPPTPMPGCKMLRGFLVTPGASDIGLSANHIAPVARKIGTPLPGFPGKVRGFACKVCDCPHNGLYSKRRAFALSRHNSGYNRKRGPRGRFPSLSFLRFAGPASGGRREGGLACPAPTS